MTKDVALIAMENGERKIAHHLFSDNEYIEAYDEHYYRDEQGLLLPKDEFWKYRTGKQWETGWKIVG